MKTTKEQRANWRSNWRFWGVTLVIPHLLDDLDEAIAEKEAMERALENACRMGGENRADRNREHARAARLRAALEVAQGRLIDLDDRDFRTSTSVQVANILAGITAALVENTPAAVNDEKETR